jgi:hypothetical protein
MKLSAALERRDHLAIHTKERFQAIVNTLNELYKGAMVFQLAGSLANKPASFHDADIIVYPALPMSDGSLEAFARGCAKAGSEVVAIDKDSRTPFPGRPDGQWRVQIKFSGGELVDLFFPKPSTKKT